MVLGLFFNIHLILGQHNISGVVTDEDGQSLIGASVSWAKSNTGTTTGLDGDFQLISIPEGDTLHINYIGFQKRSIYLNPTQDTIVNIKLGEGVLMNTINVTASKSMASEFSSMELDKLDVYLNPVSQGDPLRAITLLPSSTNADETANPELRGAAPSLSAVVINGIPLADPVKANSINGIGYFSLINPEILEEMSVYPSNPPLYIGQTIGGLVEIKTADELDYETLDVSISAASVGTLFSKKIQDEKGYIQAYGNYQFSPFFKLINGSGYDFLNEFSIIDAGFNSSFDLGGTKKLKFLSYFITEKNDVDVGLFNYRGVSKGSLTRNFNILNFSSNKGSLFFDTSLGIDFRKSETDFGNLKLDQERLNGFWIGSMDKYWNNGLILKVGLNYRLDDLKTNDIYPPFYTSFNPNNQHLSDSVQVNNLLHNPEAFGYLKYESGKWIFSTGLRYGVSLNNGDFLDYISAQANVNFNWSKHSKILLGVGNYNKVLQSAAQNDVINHLQSQHVTLEYFYKSPKWEVQVATFYKHEAYSNSLWSVVNSGILAVREKNIYGAEAFARYNINDEWMVSASNTYLKSLSGENDLLNPSYNYFFKGNVQYTNQSIGTIGLAYINRPGKFYNTIENGIFSEELDDYVPLFDSSYVGNSEQFGMYSNLSLNYSRLFFLKNDMTIIGFITVNNILNSQNVRSEYYNLDYTQTLEETYQPASLYFGAVFKF